MIQTIQSGIPVARIELMDTETVDTVNKYSKLSLPIKNLLLLEFHGTEAGTKEQAEMVQALAAENGGGDFAWTSQAEERSKMWQARHDAAWAAKAAKPGWGMWATDVCVPISRSRRMHPRDAEGHRGERALCPDRRPRRRRQLPSHHDGQPRRPDLPEARRGPQRPHDRPRAALGGTCTGEHGVGIGKIKYLYEEHGEAMSLMRSIKKALDPDNIMNPGKIIGPIN